MKIWRNKNNWNFDQRFINMNLDEKIVIFTYLSFNLWSQTDKFHT